MKNVKNLPANIPHQTINRFTIVIRAGDMTLFPNKWLGDAFMCRVEDKKNNSKQTNKWKKEKNI